jgi:hypothetical protein
MASSQTTASETNHRAAGATLARALAPEDIRPGDYVSPLHLVCEAPSYWWRDENWNLPREEPVRIRYITNCDGAPLRVKSVCLPFVLVKQPGGKILSLDMRKCQFARLDANYARRAWKAFKKANASVNGSCGDS